MSAESAVPASAAEPDGPGHDALDVLYRFVAAIELSPTVAVHSIDRDGIVRYWNHACSALFGIPASQAIGQPLAALRSHLDQQAQLDAVLAAIWESGQAGPARDWQVELRDGSRRWVYSSHFPVLRDGNVVQIFCMEIDVTERKREESLQLLDSSDFRELYKRSTDAIVLIRGAAIIDANPAALALFHCQQAERMVGRGLLDFSPATQPDGRSSAELDARLKAETYQDGNRRYEWCFQLPDGGGFWGEVLLTSVSLDHEFLSYAVIRDISPRKAAERTLQLAAKVFDNSRDAILVMDPQYRVVAANQAFSDITGYPGAQVIGGEAPCLRSGVHEPAFYEQLWTYVSAHGHWEGEVWARRASGQEFPLWVALTAIRESHDEIAHYMAILSDITDRKRQEEHTRHLAEHDFLTDLPNRVLFLDRLHQALANARRQNTRVALMFIDLDRFKAINDLHGHQLGDQVLREVSGRLTKCVRGVDTVSRQGGDEFVVILADIGGVDQAAHVAGSVMQAVARPIRVGDLALELSVSIGISIYPGDGEDGAVLLQHADVAMYHAKQNGRNAFRFFSPEMNAHVIERVEIENQLRQALARKEFLLEYQPEVDIASGRTVAVEALIRWRHPERGLLQPEQFIPAAEDCGLMVPIGEWVLEQACAQARSWRDQGFPVVVAVNLSNVQFMHNNLVHSVGLALQHSGLAAQFLDLEITEGVIMSGDKSTIGTINALRKLGVRLTIDDFGTGYSSLSHLRRFPLSKLKIDRSFVGDIALEADGSGMIPAIIALARSLKLRVAAEGVETAEQLRYLQQHGCDEYQGYYASMASPNPDLAKTQNH
ncbi:MAG: EAL domain-containing protein [Pseudomonadota bacterium]